MEYRQRGQSCGSSDQPERVFSATAPLRAWGELWNVSPPITPLAARVRAGLDRAGQDRERDDTKLIAPIRARLEPRREAAQASAQLRTADRTAQSAAGSLLRAWRAHTGSADRQFLDQAWPDIVRALEQVRRGDSTTTGDPASDIFALAGLVAGAALASDQGDAAVESAARDSVSQRAREIERRFWRGNGYASPGAIPRPDTLRGLAIARCVGLPRFLEEAHVNAALSAPPDAFEDASAISWRAALSAWEGRPDDALSLLSRAPDVPVEAVFLALSGQFFHGPRRELALSVRVSPANFRTPVFGPEGAAAFVQRRDGENQRHALTALRGVIRLRTVRLGIANGFLPVGVQALRENRPIDARVASESGLATVTFDPELTLTAGQTLYLSLV